MAEYDPLEDARRREAERKAKKAAEDKAREERGKTSGRDQATMELELSLYSLRLEQTQAKEQFDLAANKYAASNSVEDKKAYDEAKRKYYQANAALRSAGVEVDSETGKQSSTVKRYTDRPSNPVGRGINPYTDTAVRGADTPTERAKTAATGVAPTYIQVNPLDNSRWNNAFDLVPGTFDHYWKQDTAMTPISFFANSVGSIYQKENGSPETQNEAVSRILNEYANAGKMNELRDLLVTSTIASSPADQVAMAQANKGQNSQYGIDPNTRDLVLRAVQFGTYFNATAVRTGEKPISFSDFLKAYKGELNPQYDQNGGGGGLPRRTVNINKRVFTPEELELNIDAFFQEYTGQGASQEDVDYLVKKFNKQSPEKTVSVRSGNTVTSTTTGGISQAEQQLAMREMALQDPEAESYNKATTYLNYFREALASPIELG